MEIQPKGDEIMSCHQTLKCFFIGLALLVAILVSVLPKEQLIYLINITRFFEVMIPILAVGALFKYLCSGDASCCNKDES
ncbi:MAG: hypothetical protein HON78_05575 [Legionellales bacterium]|jgi:hypothetical protein|nr:hypothetical protein [Legionellales bacterium]